jgi:hypothetical protein
LTSWGNACFDAIYVTSHNHFSAMFYVTGDYEMYCWIFLSILREVDEMMVCSLCMGGGAHHLKSLKDNLTSASDLFQLMQTLTILLYIYTVY